MTKGHRLPKPWETPLLFCNSLGAENSLKAHVSEELMPTVVLFRFLVDPEEALSERYSSHWRLALERNYMTLVTQSFFFLISDKVIWPNKWPGQ